jgi:hypothetical protein
VRIVHVADEATTGEIFRTSWIRVDR